MMWEVLLCVFGGAIGVCILLQSRKLVAVKRWFDVGFLQGFGLIAWGIVNLTDVFLPVQVHLSASLLYYLLFLLSLHSLPLSSRLYYDRWKTVLDTFALAAVFEVFALYLWETGDMGGMLPVIMHFQCGMFLLITALTMLIANRQLQGPGRKEKEKLLVTVMAFVAVKMISHFLAPLATFLAALAALLFLAKALKRFGQARLKQEPIQAEYSNVHEKLIVAQWDANMVLLLLLLTAVVMLTVPHLPPVGMAALGLCAVIGCLRLFLTNRSKHLLMNEAFQTVNGMNFRLEQQMEQIESKNKQLSLYLRLKKTYENLLIQNNEHSLRPVTYGTLEQILEELIDAWFSKMDSLVYLRLSMESEQGAVYYESERGVMDSRHTVHKVEKKIIVDEQRDTALTPRYVKLSAHTLADVPEQRELEQSFFQLLLVNVRGLILRSFHDQQSMELYVMEKEMELARKIQSLLIPKEQLSTQGLRARAVYSPITYVGGDYLDYIQIDERYICFLVADVSGHGLPASLLATGIRSAARAVLQKSWSPDEILSRLNQLLYEDLSKTRSFITMLVAVYDSLEHKLLISRAGHPEPIYLSATQKSVLRCGGGVGLGLLPDSVYPLEEVPLREEGVLLIYTDGLTEMRKKEMSSHLHRWLHDLYLLVDKDQETSHAILDRLESYFWKMTREGQQTDDVSVLILQFDSVLDKQQLSIGI